MSYRLFRVKRIWHYRFQVGKVRIQRSTRERLRPRAEPVAERAYAAALARANGGEPVPTLAELIAEWVIIRAPVSSASHVRSVDVFARRHLYGLGGMPIDALLTRDVEVARNEHLLTRKPSSCNAWLRILKLLVNWAVARKVIPALPWKVAMLPVQKRPRAILPLDAAGAWFAAVDEATRRRPFVGTAIRLMFGLGLRASEAAGARWEWIDWERKTYTPGITKGREADPVPMMDWLVDHLAPLRRKDGLIAPRADGTPLPEGFARYAMRAANANCSVSGITPHRLRGTFATLLSEEGVPIQTIKRVMRHKHPMTTMAYLESDLATAAKAQNRIGGKIQAL